MPGANPASEEVMSPQRPIPSLARPLSRLSPLTLALRWALLGLSAAGAVRPRVSSGSKDSSRPDWLAKAPREAPS
ncbi:hypothetical protein CW299_36240, partial [Pseudomonas aeruginosa]